MGNTSDVGNKTEGVILGALVRLGYRVLIPFGGGHPYDLAVDHDGTIERVECKTGRLRDGVVIFNAYATYRDYKDKN